MAGFFDALSGMGAGFSGQGQEWQKNYALRSLGEKLQNGEIDQQEYLRQLAMTDPMAARQVAGVNKPSSLQELAAYETMTPEQRDNYWNIKRAAPVVNLGGTQAVLSPSGTGQPVAQLPVTLKPEDRPENAGAKAEATGAGTAKGTKAGAAEGTEAVKYIQAPQVNALLDEAESYLPKATSGGGENLYKSAAAFFGKSTEGSKFDSKLKIVANQLTAKVPRFEGPQSDKDVASYKEAAGDLANPNLPIDSRMEALKTLREINNKYLNKNSVGPAAVTSIPAAQQPKFLGFEGQ